MPSEKFFVHKEDGSLVRLKGRLVRFLDEEPPTGSDKSAIRTALEVSPDAEGLVQADVGTGPQNLVLHQHLGTLAYANADGVSVASLEVTDKIDGSLGIGVTPDKPLHVGGAGEQTLRLENTSDGLGDGSVVGSIEFEANDSSTNGSGVVSKIQSESLNATGNLFGLSFHTGHGGSMTEKMLLDNDGRLGIGTTSPQSKLHVFNSTADNLRLERDATNDWRIQLTGGALAFRDATADVERWRIDSSGNLVANGTAIDFGSGASTTISSYEEGSWTPVFAPETGSFTTMTMNVPSARYTRIGNICHIRAYIQSDSVDATGASGTLRISGLPFTAASNFMSVNIGYANNWGAAPTAGYVASGGSLIILTKRNTGITGAISDASVADLTTGAVSNANSFILNGAYEVA